MDLTVQDTDLPVYDIDLPVQDTDLPVYDMEKAICRDYSVFGRHSTGLGAGAPD